jgi:hypothetical protein
MFSYLIESSREATGCKYPNRGEPGMRYRMARALQFCGLVILPVAIAGNLAEHLTLWRSLSIAGAGMLVFYLGWLLQQGAKPE